MHSVFIILAGIVLGCARLVKGPVKLGIGFCWIVFDLDAVDLYFAVTVDRNDELALKVLLSEFGLVHHEVSAALKALVQGQGNVCIRLSRAMKVLLLDDLALSLGVRLRPDLSQPQLDGRVLIVA